MATAARSRFASAQRLRDARAAWGWSQNDLAAEVEKIRTARGLKAAEPESLRRQIIGFEKGRNPGPLWRSLLADALQDDEDRLFGLVVDAALPRPLLVQTPLNSEVLGVILAQRAAHIRAEHLFGPDYARALVVLRDYHSALDHFDTAARAYCVAPSDRARRELRHCRKIIRDRARADKSLPLLTLRRRIEATLRGDTQQ